jgi:L-threonylcarbamoyladenylate synthase
VILTPTPKALRDVAARLSAGELIGVPTETVYGLGANAWDPVAVAKIFSIKNRPFFDPLIVHVPTLSAAQNEGVFSDMETQIASQFWPGPLSIIVPRQKSIPPIVTSGLDYVALRVPSHPVFLKILNFCECPVAAPSANPFGGLSPTLATHVETGFSGQVAVVDGGACTVGIESTVVQVVRETLVVRRLGGVPVDALAQFGLPVIVEQSASRPAAPGQLDRHYQPKKPLYLAEGRGPFLVNAKPYVGYIAYQNAPNPQYGFGQVRILSPSGTDIEAAARFFSVLHELDSTDVEEIWIEQPPNIGLGVAIRDRLSRATM